MHDGWGVSNVKEGNAIEAGVTTNMDTLGKEGDVRLISAHGLSVGLNDGLMGNSEVGCVAVFYGVHASMMVDGGMHFFLYVVLYPFFEFRHLNIGAGRIVWQDIVRIDESIRKNKFEKVENIFNSLQRAKNTNGRLHLLGLVRVFFIAFALSFFRLTFFSGDPHGTPTQRRLVIPFLHRSPTGACTRTSIIYSRSLTLPRRITYRRFMCISSATGGILPHEARLYT